MKRLVVAAFGLWLAGVAVASATEDTLRFGRFGKVWLYRDTPNPTRAVVFVSGDGGWNLGVVDMARALAGLDALVIGVDITHYLGQLKDTTAEKCSYPAGDFEALSQYVQKRLEFPQYIAPVLVGYSSGATLVYAILVEAPPTTFQGAISLGFCPDLPLTKPFCRGNGLEWGPGPKGKGYSFLPAGNLEAPWVAFQGMIDQVCDPKSVVDYVRQVKNGQVVEVQKVGHGFSVQKNWMPQFKSTFANLVQKRDTVPAAPSAGDVGDLPLVEVPAQGSDPTYMAVVISGDGGWASIDRQLGSTLAGRGIPVIGLNSLRYFWKRRTPEEAAKDLERITRHYLVQWKKQTALLIGYSRGADVLPFMANRLPDDLKSQVKLVVLIGPEHTVDFQFHVTDWLGGKTHKTDLPVVPEVEKLRGMRILCLYGDDETDSACRDLEPGLATVISRKGGHHFGGDYQALAETILSEATK